MVSEVIRIDRVRQKGAFYLLAVSTRDEALAVPAELYRRYRLKEGIVITAPQLESLEAEIERFACESEVARLLGLREHSAGDLAAKLRRKGFSREVVAAAVGKYTANGLVDDRRYAHMLARQTLERKPCGRSYLVAVLQRKMIERSLAETTVGQLLAERDPETLALAALKRKWPELSRFDLETARRKAYTYLSRRGIEYAAAKAAFETLYASDQEEKDD